MKTKPSNTIKTIDKHTSEPQYSIYCTSVGCVFEVKGHSPYTFPMSALINEHVTVTGHEVHSIIKYEEVTQTVEGKA